MKTVTDEQLIAMGLQVQEARRKGGKTVFKKYGTPHFSKLALLSAEKRRNNRDEAKKLRDL